MAREGNSSASTLPASTSSSATSTLTGRGHRRARAALCSRSCGEDWLVFADLAFACHRTLICGSLDREEAVTTGRH